MKFYQGFIGLLGIASGLIYAALNFFVDFLVNGILLALGILILALDVFAFLVWFVNWRYYPETRN